MPREPPVTSAVRPERENRSLNMVSVESHQECEVLVIEARARRVADFARVERGFETPERVAPALRVRIVRREHEQLFAAGLDQPAGVLEREQADAHLTPQILGRLELE